MWRVYLYPLTLMTNFPISVYGPSVRTNVANLDLSDSSGFAHAYEIIGFCHFEANMAAGLQMSSHAGPGALDSYTLIKSQPQ